MSSQDSQGRYIPPDETLTAGALASASRNTSTVGDAFDTPDTISLTGTLSVTTRSGTNPTLDVRLETSGDGGSTYETVSAFTQVTGPAPTITHATTTPGDDSPTVDEIQTATIANADGGTFTLTYSGQTTAAIPYAATGAAITTALEALSNIAPADLVATRVGDVITLTFGGTLAATDVAQLTSSATGLSGTDITPEVKVFAPVGPKCRWGWTIGGTGSPAFTFAVSPVTANRDN